MTSNQYHHLYVGLCSKVTSSTETKRLGSQPRKLQNTALIKQTRKGLNAIEMKII